jgi:hypothetical protein
MLRTWRGTSNFILVTAASRRTNKDKGQLALPDSGTMAIWFLLYLTVAPTRALQYPGHGLDVDNALQSAPAGG